MSKNDVIFCSECSLAAGEQRFATAPRADVWLLLEHGGKWGNKALPESDLAQPIKQQINGWMSDLSNPKFLFIKRGRRAEPDGDERLTFFVAVSSAHDPKLYQFQLESYDDLLTLDVPAVVQGDSAYAAFRRNEPIFTVCTNGKRDFSCSKYGAAMYAELEKGVGTAVWQSTHIGGHRFAPAFVMHPLGACYGHVEPSEYAALIDHCKAGTLMLNRLRGRSCYAAPVQAADYYLREQLGLSGVADVKLVDMVTNGGDSWTVRLETTADQIVHTLTVETYLSEWKVFKSSLDEEEEAVPQFRLSEYHRNSIPITR
jgi:hypothetical protein